MKNNFTKEELRIKQVFWRDKKTGGINSRFKVEFLTKKKRWFGEEKEVWKSCYYLSIAHDYHLGLSEHTFRDLKSAQRYLNRLLKPVPETKIITP